MTVTIEFSPEEEAALQAQALAEGLSVEQWLRKLAKERAQLARPHHPAPRGTLAEVCAQVRGLADDLDFPCKR